MKRILRTTTARLRFWLRTWLRRWSWFQRWLWMRITGDMFTRRAGWRWGPWMWLRRGIRILSLRRSIPRFTGFLGELTLCVGALFLSPVRWTGRFFRSTGAWFVHSVGRIRMFSGWARGRFIRSIWRIREFSRQWSPTWRWSETWRISIGVYWTSGGPRTRWVFGSNGIIAHITQTNYRLVTKRRVYDFKFRIRTRIAKTYFRRLFIYLCCRVWRTLLSRLCRSTTVPCARHKYTTKNSEKTEYKCP